MDCWLRLPSGSQKLGIQQVVGTMNFGSKDLQSGCPKEPKEQKPTEKTPKFKKGTPDSKTSTEHIYNYIYMAVCQNLVPVVNIKNSWDLWMFIPLKMVLIGIDPYPYVVCLCRMVAPLHTSVDFASWSCHPTRRQRHAPHRPWSTPTGDPSGGSLGTWPTLLGVTENDVTLRRFKMVQKKGKTRPKKNHQWLSIAINII